MAGAALRRVMEAVSVARQSFSSK
ncbi:hypothetical protein [Streptomyces qinzhouensis]